MPTPSARADSETRASPSSSRASAACQAPPALPARQSDGGPAARPGRWASLVFGCVVGERFFEPFNLSLILQQVTIVGTSASRQTLIVLTAGIDLSVGAIMVLSLGHHGQARGAMRHAGAARRSLVGFAGRRPPAASSTACWSPCAAAALHRHAGHLEHLLRAQSLVLAERDHPRAGHRGDGAAAAVLRHRHRRRAARGSPTARSSWCCSSSLFWYVLNWTRWGRHVYATGDDPDAARLAGIRTEPHAGLGLCRGRPDLRARRLGPDRPHRLGQPAGRPDRQPRIPSPPWSSAAPACSAGAARSSAP